MKDTVYYLPGMGGRLETGLGEGIIQRGYNVVGQATLGSGPINFVEAFKRV